MTASAPARPTSASAMQLIELLADPGTWSRLDVHEAPGVDEAYADRLSRARERPGEPEAVVIGTAAVDGERVVLVVSEFSFMGGSVGHRTADLVAAAIGYATTHRLPLVLAPRSGGTRMQEGASAFARMIDLVHAIELHRAAGLISLAYLRNPTTGGVLASWGSLATLTYAESGALLGFLGPKVFERLHGTPFPDGVQTSENLAARGVIDGVLDVESFRILCATAVRLSSSGQHDQGHAEPRRTASRHDRSATLAASVVDACEGTVPVNGDGAGNVGTGATLALGRAGGLPVVVFALGTNPDDPGTSVADLLLARRGMRLAESLRLPFVSFVDTPGGELSTDAENRGLAREIARCMRDLAALTVPSVSVLLDRGCGGAALALMGGRSRIALEHAWLAPLPAPGASVLMFGETGREQEVASLQRVRAAQLHEDGVVHLVIPAQGPDHDLPVVVLDTVRTAIEVQRDRPGSAAAVVARLALGQDGVGAGSQLSSRTFRTWPRCDSMARTAARSSWARIAAAMRS